MDQKYFIGVDISKSKVDYVVVDASLNVLVQGQIKNQRVKLRSKIRALIKEFKTQTDSVLVCCEHTGIYNCPLQYACVELGVFLWEENPIKIKRASSNLRGKSDEQDALRIAEYSVRYRDRAIAFEPLSEDLATLKTECKVRETLLAKRVALQNQIREAKSHDPATYAIIEKAFRPVIKELTKGIKQCEKRINQLAASNEEIKQNLKLVTSIKGVGIRTAVQFIIYTNNFRRFHSAKHLACYAGVVPFANESGTISKPRRVSKMANMVLKKLLHTAAMSALRFNTELKQYYERKLKEGKNKMSVINALRNKLVHRIFAVVQRQTPYIEVGYVSFKKEHKNVCN